jgi:hypothetical protein
MDRAADNHYPTSVLDVIKSRDVASIAEIALSGATVPMLPHALAVEVWGLIIVRTLYGTRIVSAPAIESKQA